MTAGDEEDESERGRTEGATSLGWWVEQAERTLIGPLRTVLLTQLEAQLLRILLREQGSVVTHAELSTALWQDGAVSSRRSSSIRSHMHTLRQKLRAAGVEHEVKTLHALGYRLDLPRRSFLLRESGGDGPAELPFVRRLVALGIPYSQIDELVSSVRGASCRELLSELHGAVAARRTAVQTALAGLTEERGELDVVVGSLSAVAPTELPASANGGCDCLTVVTLPAPGD